MNAPSGASKALLISILKHLGQAVPSEQQLEDAIRAGLSEVKQQQGYDPAEIKYKMVVPIDMQWIKQF